MTTTPIDGRTTGTRDTRWLALVVIAVAQLMVALDATIVNISLPTAQAALGFGDADRTWVVTAYTCTFAGLLLLGGRVADRFGRRRAFLGGLLGFATASALAGLAPTYGVLITGRALQGAFAAVLAPTALSLVATTFQGRERAKAFGVYGAVASSGAAVGLLLGGVLTEYAGWRWCLFVNVAIAGAAALAGRAFLPADDGHPDARTDVVSGLLVTSGLAAVVLGCSQAAAHGWSSANVLAPLAVGVLLVTAFLVRQRRSAAPMLPLRVLADRSRAGAYLAVAISVVGSFGMFLMLTYHFQVVLGWSPVHSGLAFLPLSLTVSASAFGLGSRLLPLVAPRYLIAGGIVPAAAGLALLTTLTPGSSYLAVILPAELLLGLGSGLIFTPAISVATSEVEPRYAGIAAATANTAMQVGSSVGTAVLNSVAVAATAAYAGTDPRAALVHGYATATGWSAAALGVTAVLVLVLVRTPRPEQAGMS
ncbi:MFS transporter [Nocardioides islandensis]|uniref:MFS transporter n=1 Tax=Nocardioides islandensis TaxID=433663 RepID=A0A930VCN9_9ACTN|nr:MFS transporter [Nocardioides islandensis]MBF4762410.1 MFS transporter [Nocardioides islandensis]